MKLIKSSRENNFFFALIVFLTKFVTSQCSATGKNVTVFGYIMDNFCIERGNLFDNPSVKTLENPSVHSIHCLVEVPQCVSSLYSILAESKNATSKYVVSFKFGEDATNLLKNSAISHGTDDVKGYQANVTGVDDGTGELKCVKILNSLSSAGAKSATDTNNGGANEPKSNSIKNFNIDYFLFFFFQFFFFNITN
ncbi:hypothetical protein HDU92_005746 [Lobulomyces angularis]|nr:hypothetical protein HDU92_005746 [Lobulomyces angularis]